MKFIAVVLLALVAVSQANLEKDFDDLRQLLPKEQLQKLVDKHSFLDNEFIQFRKFVRTSDFSQIWDTLLANKNVQNVVEYSLKSGADVVEVINSLAKLLNLKSYPVVKENHVQPRTVQSFVKSVVQLLSKSEIPAVMKQKMKDSSEFKNFITVFKSDEMKKLLDAMTADTVVQALLKVLEKRGLRYKDVIGATGQMLDWAY